MRNLEKEIETLRYHQQLLLNIIRNSNAKFDLLIVEKNLTREEVQKIYEICELLNKHFIIEKAEGFLNFQPLFSQLERSLSSKFTVKELIDSFLSQGLYMTFMKEMSKFLH